MPGPLFLLLLPENSCYLDHPIFSHCKQCSDDDLLYIIYSHSGIIPIILRNSHYKQNNNDNDSDEDVDVDDDGDGDSNPRGSMYGIFTYIDP